jgi:hypothetical protein
MTSEADDHQQLVIQCPAPSAIIMMLLDAGACGREFRTERNFKSKLKKQ